MGNLSTLRRARKEYRRLVRDNPFPMPQPLRRRFWPYAAAILLGIAAIEAWGLWYVVHKGFQ